jgi:hypothetical protein
MVLCVFSKFLRVFFIKLSGLYNASINIIPDFKKKVLVLS